ncbi:MULTISPECIES: 16S rRNA (guanine(966)-N(2))-methyltransferase RsmD [Treponema]|uniref:16S rRNA (guanine(966)-N(2))-methyltransferase RsmD n=1 Tax=Treponema sp. TaxID=166 RepID=UPI0023530DA4|nr:MULTISPECIES: 16S rRNA (guanine(966)-N(2))-methyltransferase RsmD [Treponema]MDD7126781.1 16S rRNA (guanine(966)-N(2))-methyltransferase RsmD [Treponema porcinum]MDY5121315.1 16S rRNA (guanine(966)-N(2))-methyltransferase RsmD [Treponema porcinum]MDY5453979.1 16S rRNA (guanine(966)-N(2))-methyltransferase RsmD [Treponema porcinum]MDY5634625.1 16S rRNA (guanine(966)-N(2))-methyltransferase RsmD [Treponema porcinum]
MHHKVWKMRITGGKLKGRIIKCPDGVIRPAMDRMRESVFAILGDLTGKSWLDLFSGSGTIAIEAVSRGASSVELCEKDRIKVNTVLENVYVTEKECGVKIQCHFMPVEYFIKRCKSQFDYIFFDPPFPYKFHEQLIAEADRRNILKDGGTILVHRPEEHFMPDEIGRLHRTDKRVYGRSIVDFYKY